ncbi:response regulator transcription factor [Micromonospora sp. NPDC047548]|uniref:response regulator transcription factor n=1 Tax=Micromonospora sp. NPDC047548 TaxID=3155624 RepID=UPI0033E0D928
MQLVRVVIQAADPVTVAGLAALLSGQPGIEVVRPEQRQNADVVVVGTDRLTTVFSGLRRAAADFGTPVVLVIDDITEQELLVAIECRVVGVIPRGAATVERLIQGLRTAASGGGVLAPRLVGDLLKHVERLRREVLAPNGLDGMWLTPREVDVVRLIADGFDTAEIAEKLNYSDRTVKKILYAVTHRLGLRSRAHAVAYALRHGII